jgi:predicted MPP superfamily phosphohydrolase
MTTGVAMGLLAAWPTAFGAFAGFQQFDVNSVDCYFSDLPEAFDGYRIALFSDAHVGSYTSGDEKVLEAAVDSLLAMKADAIFFLGDIQNVGPWELREKLPILGRLKAPDGVFSILGNHDYSTYQGGDPRRKLAYEKQTVQLEREMGWRLLLNDNYVLRHGNDSIYFCGMEDNEKVNTDHGYGRIEQAVEGVGKGQFAILLAHNPKVWRRKALPESNVQLTLSGHTHGGQVSLFGFSTTSMFYDEDKGLYQEDDRQLFVTKGLGALIPLRFNVNGEVVLLTLHRKTSPQQQSSYNEK